MLARGDRNLAKVILSAYQNGAIFDSWGEFFKPCIWDKAFEDNNVQKSTYKAEINVQDVLPWEFIDIKVTKNFLLSEYEKSKRAVVTGGCQTGCKGCGLQGRCSIVDTH